MQCCPLCFCSLSHSTTPGVVIDIPIVHRDGDTSVTLYIVSKTTLAAFLDVIGIGLI